MHVFAVEIQHVIQSRGMVRIPQKTIACIIGEFRRLRFDMGALGSKWIHRCQIKMRQDVQHKYRRRAMGVRRMLNKFDIFVGAADW